MSCHLFFLEGHLTLGACILSSYSHSAVSRFTFIPKQACVTQKCFAKGSLFDLAPEVCVGVEAGKEDLRAFHTEIIR